jgi:hypothetical protein
LIYWVYQQCRYQANQGGLDKYVTQTSFTLGV